MGLGDTPVYGCRSFRAYLWARAGDAKAKVAPANSPAIVILVNMIASPRQAEILPSPPDAFKTRGHSDFVKVKRSNCANLMNFIPCEGMRAPALCIATLASYRSFEAISAMSFFRIASPNVSKSFAVTTNAPGPPITLFW